MFTKFFIQRPIFASVIALVIILAGVVCIPILPVAQFPEITPPTVQVSTQYTGASAEVVEQTITSPLEEQINGVEGSIYMSSYSANDGTAVINVTFEIGYDLDIAAVDVQNKASIALPRLPEDVRRYGVTTKKQSTQIVLVVNLYSPDGSLDELFLSNYADINIVDALKRLHGVGDVNIFGERKYSMRYWLDPNKLASMDMTATDVINAIRDQNLQVAAGKIGEPPSYKNQTFQYTVTAKGRLDEVEEFENIIVRTRPDGSVVRLKDVARIELGAENYQQYSLLNGKNTTSIGVYQLPGSNAVDVANEVQEKMKELSKRFPKGMAYTMPYDTTMFVRAAIKEVVVTLITAILLVIIIIYIFLQDWRSTLIPAVTIPVSLVGTFGLLMALGFSINTLTLFGLVLAIGTVVDDAIVVVENCSRLIEEEKLNPVQAAIKGMSQVAGPVIATTLVLFAVLVPVSFMPGINGQLYKQFVLTIACAVGISTINALSLSPALCAILLRPKKKHQWKYFEKFNEGFAFTAKKYRDYVADFIDKWKFVLVAFLLMILATYALFKAVPTGFVPDEDQGYFFVLVKLPDGASLERTSKVTDRVDKIARDLKGVADTITIGGFNLITGVSDSSASTMFVVLEPWDDRQGSKLEVNGIIETFWFKTKNIAEAVIMPFNPPPIQGLSTTGGFQFELQDYEGGSLDRLYDVAMKLIDAAANRKELTRPTTNFTVNTPQFYIDLDRTKVKSLGVEINDVFQTLQAYLGALYVNDFNKFGRVYRVYVQAEKGFRSEKFDISRLYVRNNREEMVPLSAVAQIKDIRGVQSIHHYNVYRAVEINGNPAQGYSSGQAIAAMEEVAEEVLPDGFGYEWTGTAYQEVTTSGQAPFIMMLSIIFVFLFLAAQYESWSLPVIILLSVPLAMLGGLGLQGLRGLANDVYCQIGLVMLIGLASKNAILIVEFAKQRHEEGLSPAEAALDATHVRFRPVLMTAFSFIIGTLPLVVATGAGAASRQSLGTTVLGGMTASTFLSLGLVPVFYVVIMNMKEKKPFGKLAAITKEKIKHFKKKK